MANHDSIYCPNCRKHTNLINRGRYNVSGPLAVEIGECNSCSFFLLVHRAGSNIIETHPKALPRPVDERIPEVIASDFKEALNCFSVNAYRAASVMARRAIQTICLEKGAPKGKKLSEQIDWLFDNRVITTDLQGWAHEVRFIGNDGAHPDLDDPNPVSRNDALDILDLFDEFAKVLYVAPAIAEERRKLRTA